MKYAIVPKTSRRIIIDFKAHIRIRTNKTTKKITAYPKNDQDIIFSLLRFYIEYKKYKTLCQELSTITKNALFSWIYGIFSE